MRSAGVQSHTPTAPALARSRVRARTTVFLFGLCSQHSVFAQRAGVSEQPVCSTAVGHLPAGCSGSSNRLGRRSWFVQLPCHPACSSRPCTTSLAKPARQGRPGICASDMRRSSSTPLAINSAKTGRPPPLRSGALAAASASLESSSPSGPTRRAKRKSQDTRQDAESPRPHHGQGGAGRIAALELSLSGR